MTASQARGVLDISNAQRSASLSDLDVPSCFLGMTNDGGIVYAGQENPPKYFVESYDKVHDLLEKEINETISALEDLKADPFYTIPIHNRHQENAVTEALKKRKNLLGQLENLMQRKYVF